jgi:hypothetical protein
MLKSLSCFLIIIACVLSCKSLKKDDLKHEKTEFIFPLDWIGQYEGELQIFNSSPDTTKIKMSMTIGYPNAQGYYPWTIVYGEDDIRSYGLEVVNPQTGHYRIDEFNSIRIDGYHRAGHFISRFEVLGSDLMFDYQRTKGGIKVLIFVSRSTEISLSGNEIISSDTIPEVKSYPIVVFQNAFLKKIDKDQ